MFPVPFVVSRHAVGRAKQKAYFVALLWPALQAARTSHGLPSSSPHITLGFGGADIHFPVE